jgi:hypothetical protein
MRRNWKTLAVFGLALLGLTTSCKRTRPPVPPQQAQAPTITEPQPQPQPLPVPAQSQTQPAPAQPTVAQQQPAPTPPPAAKKAKPRKRAAKKPAPEPNKQQKAIVKDGGAQPSTGGQLVAGLPQNELDQQREKTAQLLRATDGNIKIILTHSLSPDEEETIRQIRSFMQQARDANKDGDTERAYNLALKANLLSKGLIRP